MSLDKLKTEEVLRNSGVFLENDVLEILSKKWICIPGRYYIDDLTSKSREIDILAYRTKKFEFIEKKFRVTSAVIVSCKHSNIHKWVFSCEKSLNNLNMTKYKQHVFTNTMLGKNFVDSNSSYPKRKEWLGKTDLLGNKTDLRVNNFVEIVVDKNGNYSRDRNSKDRGIYDSIESLIKAVNYEKQRLLEKEKKSTDTITQIYDFTLLSIFDNGIYVYNSKKKEFIDSFTNSFAYHNMHIINKVQDSFTIFFMDYSVLKENISKLDSIFDNLYFKSVDFYKNCIESFLNISNIEKNKRIYKDTFSKIIIDWNTDYELRRRINSIIDIYISDLDVSFNEYYKSKGFLVNLSTVKYMEISESQVELIVNDSTLQNILINILKRKLKEYPIEVFDVELVFYDFPF